MEEKILIGREHLERMRVPELHWIAKLSEIPEHCPQKVFIEKYLETLPLNLKQGIGLFLHGEYGEGKSAISCIILKAVASIGQTGLFVRADEIPDFYFHDRWFDNDNTYVERMKDVDLLVIDELIFKDNDKVDFLVESLVRYRISQLRSTIITSNLAPETVKTKYPALAEVLKESVVAVKCRGHNFRDSIKKEIEERFKT